MKLNELMAQKGWSAEDVAAILAEQGVRSKAGNAISKGHVAFSQRGEIPAHWRYALTGEGQRPEPSSEPFAEIPVDELRPGEVAPKPPPGASFVVEAGAQKRIAGAYRFLGAALAAGSGSQGVAHVWDDSADKIAELWISAAEQNPYCRRFVELMSAGGPVGDLAAGHLYLAGATLYVLGAGIPGGDAVFAKYSRFRPVVVEPRQPGGQNGGAAGAAAPSPEDALGDVPL